MGSADFKTYAFGLAPAKHTARLILRLSNASTTVDSPFSLYANLSVQRTGQIILLWAINGSGFEHTEVGEMTDGMYSRSFKADSPGKWEFKLVWPGDDLYEMAESNTVAVNVRSAAGEKQNATISIAASASSVAVGTAVTISGSLSPPEAGVVAIAMSLNGSTYAPIGTALLYNGTYSFQILLNESGIYSFRAFWAGNDEYNPTTSSAYTVTAFEANLATIDLMWYALIVFAAVVVVLIFGIVHMRRK